MSRIARLSSVSAPLVRAGFAARRVLAAYGADRSGAIAVIFIVALIPLLAAAGAAIDISRAYVVKQRLGYAVDAAGLAVGASISEDEDELQDILERYFAANYPADEVGVPATPRMVISGDNITVTATAEVGATLMRIMGVETIDVGAEALIVRKVTGLDVALVLDNSTSMAGSKIEDLKDAAQEFVNILFGEDDTSETLQIGVVPFSSTVSIGTSMSSYTIAATTTERRCSGPWWRRRCEDVTVSAFDPYDWEGCVEARTYPKDSNDAYSGSSDKWMQYAWPSDGNNNWPTESGSRGQYRGPNKYCPVAIQPLSGTKSTVLDVIDDMEANGLTHINLGAVWGWRVVSPSAPFTQAHAYDDEDYNHAVVIMTDGENFVSSSNYTSYGYLSEGRLGTTYSTSSAEGELDDRLIEVCTGMKNLGIIVYTITFDVGSTALQTLMRSCATDSGKYFNSPSANELRAAFRSIGAQLSNLRLGR